MCSRCVVETGTGESKCFKSHGDLVSPSVSSHMVKQELVGLSVSSHMVK